MSDKSMPKDSVKFEIQAYKRPRNIRDLIKTHVPFSGAPQLHPYEAEKVILVTDPFSTHSFYYEFAAEDISYLEELPSLVDIEGKTIAMARIWVEKGSIGLRCSPFVVEDTTRRG
jgi:inorganic pyrophosphatase